MSPNYEVGLYSNDTPVTTGLVGSGFKVKVTSGGSLFAEYTAILYGDVDGDGTIGAIDLLKIKKHLLGMKVLSGSFYVAANTDRDAENTVDGIDLLKVKQQLLRMNNINQY